MRKDSLVLFCILSVSLASAGAAWAEPALPVATPATPSLTDEALRIWNQAPATDANDYTPHAAVAFQRYRTEPSAAGSEDVKPSYQAPNGSSLTPNIDRLLQRYSPRLVPSDGVGTGFASPASNPNPFTATQLFRNASKSSQQDHNPPGHDHNPPGHDRNPPPHDHNPPPTPTPEPGTLMLFGAAAVSAAAARRRRARATE